MSAGALVNASADERFDVVFWTRKSSVVSDTISNAVLGMYDIRHLWCRMAGRT